MIQPRCNNLFLGRGRTLFAVVYLLAFMTLSHCGDDEVSDAEMDCIEALDTWTPSVTGASSSNHVSSNVVSTTTASSSGVLIGLDQTWSSAQEMSFSIDMSADLGTDGSLTLNGLASAFPAELSGGAFAVLTYLNDGNADLINLSAQCRAEGLYTCSGGSCSVNTNCTVGSTSAYFDRTSWNQFQFPAFGYASMNRFPTCDWASGSPACDFNSDFFTGGKLRTGTYTARYMLVASSYSSISGYSANLDLTVAKKTRGGGAGALDINVIFVGSENVNATSTVKGRTNLNELFKLVHDIFNQTNTGAKIGSINTFKHNCPDGSSEALADVSLSDLDELFETSRGALLTSSEGKAINLFLVSSIPAGASVSGTVLGASGAINGSIKNATGSSGIAISTFDELDNFNPSCGASATSCPAASQEKDFWELANTLSHEMGHFLGLNHTQESNYSRQDYIADTPICGGTTSLTHANCKGSAPCSQPTYNGTSTFFPTDINCEFNHVMWWTSKNYSESLDTGDGNIFSPDSSKYLLFSSFIY